MPRAQGFHSYDAIKQYIWSNNSVDFILLSIRLGQNDQTENRKIHNIRLLILLKNITIYIIKKTFGFLKNHLNTFL